MFNKKLINFYKNKRGATTIEFALVFPIIFLITFMTILFIFRIGDQIIIYYESSRLSRLESVNVSLDEGDLYYDDLINITTLNGFQEKTITNTLINEGQNLNIISNSIVVTEGSIPNLLRALSLLHAGEANPEDYNSIQSNSIRIKEPYLP